MPTVLNLSGKTVLAERSNNFDALDAGTYGVTIFDVKKGEIAAGKRNAGAMQYNVQFKVLDGQPGANRRHFETITFAPSWPEFGDKPEADNFGLFNFLAAVQGRKSSEVRAEWDAATKGDGEVTIPSASELLGKKFNITLSKKPDPFGYKRAKEKAEASGEEFNGTPDQFNRNNITKYAPFAEVSKPKESVSGFTL